MGAEWVPAAKSQTLLEFQSLILEPGIGWNGNGHQFKPTYYQV